jgi:hypothetical protein
MRSSRDWAGGAQPDFIESSHLLRTNANGDRAWSIWAKAVESNVVFSPRRVAWLPGRLTPPGRLITLFAASPICLQIANSRHGMTTEEREPKMRRAIAVFISLGMLAALVPAASAQVGRYGADQTVTIRITGVKDENARKYVLDRLPGLTGSKSHSMRSSTRNNVTTVTLAPVKDPQAFADKIDFGEATVSGRTITLKVTKVDAPSASADEVTRYLFDLKSPSQFTRSGALDKLAAMSVDKKKQEDVANAIAPLLKAKDVLTPRAAAKALAVWGTKDSVKDLGDALKSKDPFTRFESMKALVALKDDAGIELVAKQLTVLQDRMEASKALQTAGPAAEAPVTPYLSNSDWMVRNEACKVLGAVGTKKSIDVLDKAAKSDENFIIRTEAGKALTAVKARGS